jgi:mannan endo-1,4-beta-mannosidase
MKPFLALLLACPLAIVAPRAVALEPANPQANAKARAILDYFQRLEARPQKRVLSGQFTDFGQGANLRLLSEIHDKTGHWPALMGVDYADFSRGSLTYQAPNQAAIAYWRQGGLVTISAHLYNPANPKGGGLRDPGVDLNTLLAPETDTHRRWMQELDLLADGLQELQRAGVVVLWRPFHEMNGGWFWWGAKEPQSFIRVWRHMFDYFTQTKHLDNLLWVYSPNHGQKTAAYYPGNHYADLVGLDAYTDFIDTNHIKGYAEVAGLGKPVGFTEFGPHGSRNPPGDYDYLRLIQGITNQFPHAVFFMSWNGKWSLARNNNTKELLAHPCIANRSDLPPDWSRPGISLPAAPAGKGRSSEP